MQPSDAREIAKASRDIHGWFEAYGLFALMTPLSAPRVLRSIRDWSASRQDRGDAGLALRRRLTASATSLPSRTRNVLRLRLGDRAIFQHSMEPSRARTQACGYYECLSSELTAEQVGPARFFHVDGGHLIEEALIDLRLGAEVTLDRGAMVIDDPFRIESPGVTEAIVGFLTERDDWAPVVVGSNKLVLCLRPSLGLYSTTVQSDHCLVLHRCARLRAQAPAARWDRDDDLLRADPPPGPGAPPGGGANTLALQLRPPPASSLTLAGLVPARAAAASTSAAITAAASGCARSSAARPMLASASGSLRRLPTSWARRGPVSSESGMTTAAPARSM